MAVASANYSGGHNHTEGREMAFAMTASHGSKFELATNQTITAEYSRFTNGTGIMGTVIAALNDAQRRELLAWSITMALICVIGVVIGILALLATWPGRRGLSGVSVLVWHLVLVNFLNSLTWYPSYAATIHLTQVGHITNLKTCQFVAPFCVALQNVVNWSEVGLALNRFNALFFPHVYRTFTTNRVNLCHLTLVWLVGTSVVYPILSGNYVKVGPLGECGYAVFTRQLHLIPFSIINYMPFVVSGAGALTTLWKTSRNSRVVGNGEMAHRRITLRRLRMAVLLVVVFVWNTACNVISIIVMRHFPGSLASSPVSRMWLRLVATIMYATTPVRALQIVFENRFCVSETLLEVFKHLLHLSSGHLCAVRHGLPG